MPYCCNRKRPVCRPTTSIGVPCPTGATGATGPTGPTGPAGISPALNAVYATNVAETYVSGTSSIPFNQNVVAEGSAISHTPGSGDFALLETGIYEITYSTVTRGAPSETYPVNLYIWISLDGAPGTGTVLQASYGNATSASSAIPISSSILVNIDTVPSAIGLYVTPGTGANVSNSHITIKKLM